MFTAFDWPSSVAIGNPSGMCAKLRTVATIEIMLAISLTIACSRYIYNGVILHAHPVRGESHNRRNTTEDVATLVFVVGKLWFKNYKLV